MKKSTLAGRDIAGVRPPGQITVQAQIRLANGIEKARRFSEVDDGFWNEEHAVVPAPVTRLSREEAISAGYAVSENYS